MKKLAMFVIVIVVVTSAGMAQDDLAVERTTAEQPGVLGDTATDDVAERSPLGQLDWMVGRWVDEGDGSAIATSCSWTKNRKYLTRSFTVTIDDQVSLEGTQVIGWDPIAGRIRSWTFDSEGGFGEGRWMRDGSRWLVKTSFVLASGERASAVNVITYVDPDTFRWQSTSREVGGELLPNIPEVTVVRQKSEHVQKEISEDAPEVSDGKSAPSYEVRRNSRDVRVRYRYPVSRSWMRCRPGR